MNWLIKWEDVSLSMSSDERRSSISKKKKNLLNSVEKTEETASLASIDVNTTNSKAVVYKVIVEHKNFRI
jgi:transcription initiation factor TFIIIB Brf1 subunit/transcription initiation factor TFIIB